MKIERQRSGDLHLSLSLLFAGLAVFLLAFKLPSLPQNPGILLIVTAIYGMVLLYIGIALGRRQWLIAPFIGVVVTLASALYSTIVYPMIPCGSTLVSQGFPYQWIRRFGFSSDGHCLAYYEPIDSGLPQLFVPRPMIAYIWFITDAVFYTLLVLAIVELVAATRRF